MCFRRFVFPILLLGTFALVLSLAAVAPAAASEAFVSDPQGAQLMPNEPRCRRTTVGPHNGVAFTCRREGSKRSSLNATVANDRTAQRTCISLRKAGPRDTVRMCSRDSTRSDALAAKH